jgi:IS5 family transposase
MRRFLGSGARVDETVPAIEGVGVQGRSDPNHQLLDAAGLVGHLVPEASVYVFLAHHRETLFPDELFADLFPSGRGRPSVPAPVAATVMVLQSLEGLSDREAMEQLRCDIRWKVATGLALDHEGFHPTTLTYWRRRLRASERPERIFDAVREVIAQTGLLSRSTRRALDSTVLDDAVATQDTVTQLVAQIRRVRAQVPAAAEVEVAAHDYSRAGKPECDWADPAAREQLISQLVADAQAILAALEDVELDELQTEAVGLLALVAGQDVEPGEDEGSWRIARRTAKDRVISTVDPASRHVHKNRRSYRDGFKAHISVEPDSGLIAAAKLTAGNVPDGPTGIELLADEDGPVEVLADSAYSSANTLIALAEAEHTTIIKPWPTQRMTSHRQAFTITDFHVDTDAGTATCPAGNTVTISPAGAARFTTRCHHCPLRERCTTAKRGKILKIHPHHDVHAAARTAASEPDWQDRYRQHRPMVERTIAWLVRRGHRRVRFRGIAANQLWLTHRAAAVNLQRLLALGLGRNGGTWTLPAPA